jgi:MFS family permease
MKTITSHDADRGKPLILAAVCLSALVLPLAFSGGAVATPAIGRDLGGSASALTWFTNAFMLSFGSLLMAAGALADQFGRKRLFVGGLGGFIVTSMALACAPSIIWLDALRALQGVAAAASLASGTAALAQEFDGHARTRAFSMLGTSFGIGLAFGPLMAGALITYVGWRAIFVAIAAIGMVAFGFGVPRMRDTRDPAASGLDWPDTLAFTGMLTLFTFGVIQAPQDGWSSPRVMGALAASAVLLGAFVLVETRVARPMLTLSLFRYPRFVGVQMLPVGTCYCFIVLVVMLPLRFIGAEGLSAMEAGLLMIALSAPMLVVPMLAASLTRWVSPGVLSGLGFLVAAAGLYWLSRVDMSVSRASVIAPMLVIGVGAGVPWGLMDGLSVSVVPKERAGMASGIFSTIRVAGEGIALAIAMAILAGLGEAGLARIAPHASPAMAAQVAEAAQRLTTGDLAQAAASLPQIDPHALALSYTHAFTRLLHVLIVITLLSAFAAFAFLSRAGSGGDQAGDQSGEQPCDQSGDQQGDREVAESAAV